MYGTFAARMRCSDVNDRLLLPLLVSGVLVQAVVTIMRVTTSYRVVELDLPVIWLGIISSTYAILLAFIALRLGRFIDRGHDALATWIGAGLTVVACAGLLVSGTSKTLLLGSTALLGIGNLFTIVSQQMLCVRCSGPRSRESVFGNFMVACAVGQGLGRSSSAGWAARPRCRRPSSCSRQAWRCRLPRSPSPRRSGQVANAVTATPARRYRSPNCCACRGCGR